MDTVRPWIIKEIKDGPLEHYTTIESIPTETALPLEPFRGRQVQFIKFLSPHEWGSHRPVWAEASDRHVTILVYLPPEIVDQFEKDQMADRRTFSQLGYPTFSLGGCRWAVYDNNHHHQLCIHVVSGFNNKKFKFGSTATFPLPPYVDQHHPHPPSTENRPNNQLVRFDYALKNHPIWIRLNKRLQVTSDQRLLVSEILNETVDSTVQIAVPYTGPSRRIRALKARHKNLMISTPPKNDGSVNEKQTIPKKKKTTQPGGSSRPRNLINRSSLQDQTTIQSSLNDKPTTIPKQQKSSTFTNVTQETQKNTPRMTQTNVKCQHLTVPEDQTTRHNSSHHQLAIDKIKIQFSMDSFSTSSTLGNNNNRVHTSFFVVIKGHRLSKYCNNTFNRSSLNNRYKF